MSKIFELFGHRLDSWNQESDANRALAWCPFMNKECDGGGNRYLSGVNVSLDPSLQALFPGKTIVQSGVCSLNIKNGEQPWIVCPRRLLSLKTHDGHDYQTFVKQHLSRSVGLTPGVEYRAWSEVKMKVETVTSEDETKSFDYTFDYLLAGSRSIKLQEVAEMLGETVARVQKIAQANGYTLAQRESEVWIENFPGDPIVIVEIMTSSTSGGDKKKRTQISMAFEDAVRRGLDHAGPGINYRQVWARMVSQLIVKSQVGIAWNGKTVWLVQDVLADYISATTALDLRRYVSAHADEVNILAFGYGDEAFMPSAEHPVIPLSRSTFYAGPINKAGQSESGGFVDIVKIGAPPPKEHLWRSLFLKAPSGTLIGVS